MNSINNRPFYAMGTSLKNYKNSSFMKAYIKVNKRNCLSNTLFQNTSLLGNINKEVNEKFQELTYERLSKYKNNDEIFEKAIRRINTNFNANVSRNAPRLTAKNSLLDFSNGNTYTIKTKSGKTVTLTSDNGTVYMPGSADGLATGDIKEVEDLGHLLTYLSHDKTGMLAYTSFSESSIKEMLSSVGIQPGFFEVKSSSGTNKFLMLDNGSIYANYQVEAERAFYNETDLIKNSGFTKDAVCIIDGKEYKIDENGHFNIPEGVRCVSENMIIRK